MSETTQVVTTEEVLEYLGIDYADKMVTRNVERLIKTADAYLKSAIGDGYKRDDPKAKEIALIVISDLYDNRGVHPATGANNNMRRLLDDLILQLKLELRRAANGQDV